MFPEKVMNKDSGLDPVHFHTLLAHICGIFLKNVTLEEVATVTNLYLVLEVCHKVYLVLVCYPFKFFGGFLSFQNCI